MICHVCDWFACGQNILAGGKMYANAGSDFIDLSLKNSLQDRWTNVVAKLNLDFSEEQKKDKTNAEILRVNHDVTVIISSHRVSVEQYQRAIQGLIFLEEKSQ